ncbi:MAG: hypothetical protein ACK4ND_18560, partial [Cytophagaceae bacterium]
KSLYIYDNQDRIDSLDRIITRYEVVLSEKYSEKARYANENPANVPFSYKVLFSVDERIVKDLKTKYINNSLPQQEMISLGNNIICYYAFHNEHKANLDKIGGLKKYWNDSLFTIYRDNPFDFRKLETKILEGVQNASNILLTYYANQLLNAKTCEQLSGELKKINRLNERVRYLVKNQESEKVQQLNKALRRERVPVRIERILEL